MIKHWFKKNRVLLFILFLGFVVRVNRFDLFPPLGETQDELTWAWAGANLWRGDGLKTVVDRSNGERAESGLTDDELVFTDHWFDNPPLFALISGASAIWGGQTENLIPTVTSLRWPMIVIGLLNIYFVFLVGKSWFGRGEGLLAALFLATIPTMAITSRLAISENLLIFWLLMVMWLLRPKIGINGSSHWWQVGLVCGLAILTKLSGIAILVAVLVWKLAEGKSRTALKIGLLAVAIGFIYPVIGYLDNWTEFVGVGLANLREVSWASWLTIMLKPNLVTGLFLDGWIILGWVGLIIHFVVADRSREAKMLNIFILSWLAMLIMFMDHTTDQAWFRYPVFPLMCLVLARIAVKIYKTKNFWALVPVGLMGLMPNLRLLLLFQGVEINNGLARLGLVAFLIPLVILMIKPKYKLGKKVIYWLVLVLSVAVNVFVVLNISEQVLTVEQDKFGFR